MVKKVYEQSAGDKFLIPMPPRSNVVQVWSCNPVDDDDVGGFAPVRLSSSCRPLPIKPLKDLLGLLGSVIVTVEPTGVFRAIAAAVRAWWCGEADCLDSCA